MRFRNRRPPWAALPAVAAVVGAAAAAASAGVSISQSAKGTPKPPDPNKALNAMNAKKAAVASGNPYETTLLTPAAGLSGSASVQRATLLGQ